MKVVCKLRYFNILFTLCMSFCILYVMAPLEIIFNMYGLLWLKYKLQ